IAFQPYYQMQRPGLLLMNGVVYAAFGGHCDRLPFRGWIAAIGTEGRLRTLYTTLTRPEPFVGAGIWQSGGGLVSDGPGRIFFATGNQFPSTGPEPQAAPGDNLGESVSRVD